MKRLLPQKLLVSSRSVVCLAGQKMEPQITQNAQKGAESYRARTMRLISRWALATLMQVGRVQIIKALRAVDFVDRLGCCLQFDEDVPFACSACFAVPFFSLMGGTTFRLHRAQFVAAIDERFDLALCDRPSGYNVRHIPLRWRTNVRDHVKDRETLSELNRNYVRSVDEADITWFEANLASDFLNTNPDGTLIDRSAFIAQIGRGSSVTHIREHDVVIRLFGDFAIIHARTAYLKPDGTPGGGRYTDDWLFRDGRWQCISAHVARL